MLTHIKEEEEGMNKEEEEEEEETKEEDKINSSRAAAASQLRKVKNLRTWHLTLYTAIIKYFCIFGLGI